MKKAIILLVVLVLGTASFAAMRVGVENGLPYMGWQLSDMQAIDAGLGYTSTGNGAVTNLILFGKYTQNIMKVKNVNLNWSGSLGINSANAGASTTTIGLVGSVGAEYMINEVISIYGDIDLLTIQSISGAATGTNFFLINGDANCYSGIRVYI